MTSFLNPVAVVSAVLALMACVVALRYVLRLGSLDRPMGMQLSETASGAGSLTARRLVALSATGVSTGVTLRAAERHALHHGALRVQGFSGADSHFDLTQLPLPAVCRRPGLRRGSLRAERRLVVVR